jgi:hypothetical protein
MGNNSAFTAFERTVLAVYNRGVLDKTLLKLLSESYRDCDIDSGGMVGTLSKPVAGPDGIKRRLDIVEIVIQTWTGKIAEGRPKLPKDYDKSTEAQRKANDDYQDRRWNAFHKITKTFGWC